MNKIVKTVLKIRKYFRKYLDNYKNLFNFAMFVLRLESQRCDIAGFSTFIGFPSPIKIYFTTFFPIRQIRIKFLFPIFFA